MAKSTANGHNRHHGNDLVNGYQKVALEEVEESEDRDTRCGLGAFKPDCLQVFPNMITFSLYYGVSSLFTSALSMYLTSQVTTLEKQFGMSSAETGMLLSMNDFGFLIFVIFVSHFSRYAHKPRILGVCVFVFGCSAIVSAIPHFLSPEPAIEKYNMTNHTTSHSFTVDKFRGESLCLSAESEAPSGGQNMTISGAQECSQSEAKSQATAKFLALGIISAGMFVQGIAKSPRMAMSVTYIDDNVIKTKTGLHIGLIACLSIFGPATAFAIGAKISTIYVTLQDTGLTPRDPRWIGAWWLGFIVFGFAAVILSGPLCLFPRRMLIKSKDLQKQRQARALQQQRGEVKGIFAKIKDLPLALWRLLTNFTYMAILVASTIDFFSMAGGLAFSPKFFEVFFGLSVFKANMLMGTTTIIAASTGMLAGGIITTKLKLGLVGCLKLVIAARCVSGVIGSTPLFLDCPPPNIHGLQQFGFGNSLPEIGVAGEGFCRHCPCHGSAYFPVCGSDGRNFYSPCVAGCSQKMGYQYSNCSCVSNTTVSPAGLAANTSDFTAVPGLCTQECDLLTIFMVTQVVSAFLGTVSAMPHSVASLRSVSEKDKTLSVGFGSFTQSIFGWTLGPVIFGYIVDGTCVLWQTACSKRGSCALYDPYDMRNKLHGIGVGGRVICLTIFIICLLRLLYTTKGKEIVRLSEERAAGASKTGTDQKEKMMVDTEERLEPVRISSL